MSEDGVGSTPTTDAGTPSPEWIVMERSRALPRMLDSTRPDGGINRLLDSPGGRLFEAGKGERKIQSLGTKLADGTPQTRILDLAAPRFTGRRPLLIQHQAEGEQDYRFRAAVAAPRSGFWHSIESLAGRPFRQPLTITGGPEILGNDGEWTKNADLLGNSLRTLAARVARSSAGYGLAYWWVAFDEGQLQGLHWLFAPVVGRGHDEDQATPTRYHGASVFRHLDVLHEVEGGGEILVEQDGSRRLRARSRAVCRPAADPTWRDCSPPAGHR